MQCAFVAIGCLELLLHICQTVHKAPSTYTYLCNVDEVPFQSVHYFSTHAQGVSTISLSVCRCFHCFCSV